MVGIAKRLFFMQIYIYINGFFLNDYIAKKIFIGHFVLYYIYKYNYLIRFNL
jgi:hypothetical protein